MSSHTMQRLPTQRTVAFSAQRLAPRVGSLQLTRADGPRVTREYREDDGSMYVPDQKTSAKKGDDGAIYADQVQMPRKPKDGMSKEMKARLRKEYTNFGGAENTAMSSNYFLWIIVIISALAVASKLTGAI